MTNSQIQAFKKIGHNYHQTLESAICKKQLGIIAEQGHVSVNREDVY